MTIVPVFNKDLGSYMPSFFHMDLSFPFPSGPLPYMRLNEKFFSSFIHEYVHFLQDITTFTGYNNAYVYSEQVHGLVTHIYSFPGGALNIPVKLPYNYGNIDLNRFVNERSIGACTTEIGNLIITDIRENKVKIPYPNSYSKYLTEFKILSINNPPVIFGSRAIMESMAFIIESMTTRGWSTPFDFPYCSAQSVTDYIYKEFGEDPLRVLALCDMSLQFTEPGKIFIQTLKEFKEKAYLPSNPNDIIDFFYNRDCIQLNGVGRLDWGVIEMAFMTGQRMKLYLNHPNFYPFHNVIHKLFGFGMRQRLNNRYFFLDIARGGDALTNPLFMRTIREIGTPIIKDINDDYWIVLPVGVEKKDYLLDYFPAIEEVYKTLQFGNDACELYPLCEKSPQTTEDDRCIMNPWTRCCDKYLCPYAMLWRHWNLSKYIATH